MKSVATNARRGSNAAAQAAQGQGQGLTVIGRIPGLARLLPGHYVPGHTVESRYGKWTLPRSFKGRPISAIVDGILLG